MSDFMIGTTVEGLTALNLLAVPLDDPQPEFQRYAEKVRLANMTMKGRGFSRVMWEFASPTVEQVGQINAFQSADPIYIQSRDKDDAPQIYWVLMNVPDPREDGDHERRMNGYRSSFMVEFIVLSVVEGS